METELIQIKTCTRCGDKSPHAEFHKRATQCKKCRHELMVELYGANKEQLRASNRLTIAKMHEAIFAILGSSCVMCGETEKELLTVDHIHNDRKLEASYQSHAWKRQIIAGTVDRSRYQILCRNCNEARQRRNPTQLLANKPITGILQICSICRIKRDTSEFYARDRGLRKDCSHCCKERQYKVVAKCHKLLGGKCVCCGIDDYFKLHIDHIHNDGAARRKNGEKTGFLICQKIIDGDLDKQDFQLLCANCNYSKLVHDGVCIHAIQRRDLS
jgi:hypothetical protein